MWSPYSGPDIGREEAPQQWRIFAGTHGNGTVTGLLALTREPNVGRRRVTRPAHLTKGLVSGLTDRAPSRVGRERRAAQVITVQPCDRPRAIYVPLRNALPSKEVIAGRSSQIGTIHA